jgi:hypothetical protein
VNESSNSVPQLDASQLLKFEVPKVEPRQLDLLAAHQWLHELSAAGVAISGDSGSGKSVLMRQLVEAAIDSGTGAVVIDPHGDLVDAIHRDCLARSPVVRDRVLYFAPGDDRIPIGPLNPLAIQPLQGETAYGYRARLDCRTVHAAHLTINCGGEQDFDEKPQLFRWLRNIYHAIALMGLSMAHSLRFLDFESDDYTKLIDAIPDNLLQSEFRLLYSMRPAEREVFCGSTRARLNNIFSNVVLKCHLGVPRNAINVQQLIQQRAIVLINLAPMGRLHEKFHTSILANLWVAEILHTVFSTPEADRQPMLLALDELPVFRASSDLITSALRQVRKMRLRFLLAFQGIHSFPLAKDDPLLRATSMCGSSFYFRHTDEDDALYFGGKLSLPDYDLLRPKFIHYEWEQYQDGHTIETLVDQSWQRAYGTTESQGVSDTDNWQESWAQATAMGTTIGTSQSRTDGQSTGITKSRVESTGQRIQEAVGKTFGRGGGINQSRTLSEATNEGEAHTKSKTESEGESNATSQQHATGTQESSGRQESTGTSRADAQNRAPNSEITSRTDSRATTRNEASSHQIGKSDVDTVGDSVTKSRQSSHGEADTINRGSSSSVADQAGTNESWDEKDTQTRTTGTDKAVADGRSSSQETNTSVGSGTSHGESHEQSETTGNATGGARAVSREQGTSITEGESTTHKQQLVPRMKWRSVLRFVEFMSRDEQKFEKARDLAVRPTGEAFHQIAGHSVSLVRIDLPEEKWKDAPRTLQMALTRYFASLPDNPLYHSPAVILEQQLAFAQELHEILMERYEPSNVSAIATLPLTQVPDDSPFSI